MVMIAGYVNYKYNPEREKDLGKSVYVNSKDGFMYANVNIYEEEKIDKTLETSNMYKQKEAEETISNFTISRNNMFSELEESYSKVIEASSTSKEKINEYQDKLNKLIEDKHTINIVENLIKTKGCAI